MSHTTIADLFVDHKHCLRDLQQWRWYLQLWTEQHEKLIAAADEFQRNVHAHGEALEEFSRAISAHEHEIIECERLTVGRDAGSEADPELTELHGTAAHQHERQVIAYERLKQNHHALMVQLAMMRQQPFREE